MTAAEFLLLNSEFYKEENPLSTIWRTVAKQQRRHTSRDSRRDFFEKSRPGEDDDARDYREANDRILTKEGVDKFISTSVRIFKTSHIDLAEGTINKPVIDWLKTRPFKVLTQKVGFMDYFYTVPYRYCIGDDANCAWLAFPVSRIDKSQAPVNDLDEGGQPILNLPVAIESRIIPSNRIIKRDEVFAFEGETVLVELPEFKQGNQKEEATGLPMPVYYIADDMDWLQYYPIPNPNRRDVKDPRIIYEVRAWYRHATGEIPVTNLPGTLAYTNIDDEILPYYESVLHSLFEYGDGFIQQSSDLDITLKKFLWPKVIMSEMICTECHGKGSLSSIDLNTGSLFEDDKGNVIKNQCTSCGGSGVVKDPGPLQTMIVKMGQTGLDKQVSDAIYREILPPTGHIKDAYDMTFDIWEKGKKTAGIDVLGQLNESGAAHQMRLEVTQDKLGDVAEQVAASAQSFLKHVTALLVPIEKDRLQPQVIRAKELSVKPATLLLTQAKESQECARQDAFMEYYGVRFRNDPVKIRIYELAMGYSALFCLSNDEIQTRVLSGAYTTSDIVKADRAVWAFTILSEDKAFLNPQKTNEMYDKADELIAPYLPEIIPLVDANGFNQGEQGQEDAAVSGLEAGGVNIKLLETVGGVTGIIGLSQSVAEGKMTLAAATNVLVEIYGLTPEVAKKLISVPKVAPKQVVPDAQ